MATNAPSGKRPASDVTIREVELLKVLVSREGKKVTAQWALHPQLKIDLLPKELQEVSELMTQVTRIVSTRFVEVLSTTEPDKPGTA